MRKYENVKISELKPYDKNARTHSEEQVQRIADSIAEFGFINPVLIDSDKTIIAGHGRVLGAKKLGLEEVPCLFIEDLTEAQKRAYIIADNKLALDAGWDEAILKEELTALSDMDFNIELTGFTLDDIQLAEDTEPEEDNFDIDEALEDETEPVAKVGDVYKLGDHRLICGDSTDVNVIDRLMDGVKADMVFTDPPYGMNLDTDYKMGKEEVRKDLNVKKSKGYKKIIGDNNDFRDELITTIFDNFDYCKEIFVWGADYYPELLKDYKRGNYIVWDKIRNENMEEKGQFEGFGLSSFELCWSKKKHKKDIVRILWRGLFGTEKEFDHQRVHPTQKPIKLSSWFINKYSKENDLIVDIYGGSGSTLIACEQLNRKCYMCELDPHYVDVIIKRWETLTGKTAVKVN